MRQQKKTADAELTEATLKMESFLLYLQDTYPHHPIVLHISLIHVILQHCTLFSLHHTEWCVEPCAMDPHDKVLSLQFYFSVHRSKLLQVTANKDKV